MSVPRRVLDVLGGAEDIECIQRIGQITRIIKGDIEVLLQQRDPRPATVFIRHPHGHQRHAALFPTLAIAAHQIVPATVAAQ